MAKLPLVMVPEVEVLRNTDTEGPVELATAKSGLPSPFISPMLTERGPEPVAKSTLAAKLPLVMEPDVEVLRNTDNEVLP